MRKNHPNLPSNNRYSPKETYNILGISYSTLKNHTAEGKILKEYRADGSSFYTGFSINQYWENKMIPKSV